MVITVSFYFPVHKYAKKEKIYDHVNSACGGEEIGKLFESDPDFQIFVTLCRGG